MRIRPAGPPDAAAWETMRQALWPSAEGEHAAEIAAWFAGERRDPAEAFLARDGAGEPIGFAEATIRTTAQGCYSGRVTYLEGWYVAPEARRRGVGAALVRAVEEWGRAQGSTEMASDTDVGNLVSEAAHRALGFEEVVRSIDFRKSL